MAAKERKNGKLVFKWQFLIVYLLIAAAISYFLVDAKLQRELPSNVSESNATSGSESGVDVTEDDGGFGSGGSYGEVAVPGTIGEHVKVTKEETETSEPTSGKTTTNKHTTTGKHSTTEEESSSKPPKPTESTTGKEEPSSTTTTEKPTTTAPPTSKPTTTKPPTTDAPTEAAEISADL